MRNLKKKLGVIFAAVMILQAFMTASVFAAPTTGTGSDFGWEDDSDGTVKITGYDGAGGAVTVPATLGGKPVSQITASTDVFKGRTDITSVSLPACLKTIDAEAFKGCTGLEGVSFGSGAKLEEIGDSAFEGCTSLTSITITADVVSIGAGAFKGCTKLSGITFETGNLAEIGANAFEGAVITSLKIPASVVTIDQSAFKGCEKITSLTFASGSELKAIGESAFEGLKKITAVTIPQSVTSIGDKAFMGCTDLKKAIFRGDTVAFDGDDVFTSTNIKSIEGGGIYANEGSDAESYANSCHIPFHTLDYIVGTPTIYSAVSSGFDSATIFWSVAENAQKYALYRSTSATTIPSSPYKSGLTGTSYVDSGISTNTTYYYWVRGYKTSGSDTIYGDYSNYASVTPLPGAPTSISAASKSYNSIELTWTAVPGADGYKIYRSFDKAGTYTLIRTYKPTATTAAFGGVGALTADKVKYTFSGLVTGKTYYYKVKAYKLNGTAQVLGDFSGVASAVPTLSRVTNVKCTVYSPISLKITWDPVPGRTRYYIRRSDTGGDASFIEIPGGTTRTSYIDNNLGCGKTYYYQVCAYRYAGGIKSYGAYSATASNTTSVLKVTNLVAQRYSSTRIRLTWDRVNGVQGYQIYRATSSDGPWGEAIKTTTLRSFIDTGLDLNTTYYYKVRAYYGTCLGEFSDVKSASTGTAALR